MSRDEAGGGFGGIRAFCGRVDHTVLAPEATAADIDRLVSEAVELGTHAVCVNGSWVIDAVAGLAGTDIATCAVVGFPLGAMTSAAKAAEAGEALEAGAREIDMVIHLGHLLAGEDGAVVSDIAVARAATEGAILKVIIETAALDDGMIDRASRLVVDAGADFVKTSTGFHRNGGATIAAVERIKAAVGDRAGVKASGGIRTAAGAQALLAAGAGRLGLSATRAIVDELNEA